MNYTLYSIVIFTIVFDLTLTETFVIDTETFVIDTPFFIILTTMKNPLRI